jgi:predicted transposase YbfD/YdcC
MSRVVVLDLDETFAEKSRLELLLEHFSRIEDPRDPWRVRHPLPEILLHVVCATIADCDSYDAIALWGETNLGFLRRLLPYENGVPGGRWLEIFMNRIDPGLFAAAFSDWVRASWPDRPDFVAIDGKTSRRSHDRKAGAPPLHLVSAYATTRGLVLGQEAVADKSNETTAIPVLVERLGRDGGLEGALVSIDAIATNAKIAQSIRDAGADYLLAVKANQPTLRAEMQAAFEAAPEAASSVATDKGHGRIEAREVAVLHETDWLDGDRRFPGELRLPDAKTLIRVRARAELSERCRMPETRYYISSAVLDAEAAGKAVRGHWGIENGLHWVLDVTFREDQSRLRKGHGARNMAVVRHFSLNLVRAMTDKKSIKLRRKAAGWSTDYLAAILGRPAR